MTDFYRGGVASYCKPCHNARTSADAKRRREENGDRERELARTRYASNKEGYRAHNIRWRADNPEVNKDSDRRSKVKSIGQVYAINRKRVEQVKMATPPWADKQEIADWYEAARIAEQVTGKKWHVDHIHPLNGANFCGLHVGYNLQILPARENMRKGNKLEIA